MHTEFWSENLRERENFKDLGEDGRVILNLTKKKWGRRVLAGFIRLVTRSDGGLRQ
jgi:hypothetical protein